MQELSRREFSTLVVAGTVGGAASLRGAGQASAGRVTAHDVVDRMQKAVGVAWRSDTVDTVKAGDPAIVVTGIVTTGMATMAVLQQAAKAGANLLITSGPTFYSRADARNPPAGRGVPPTPDPVFLAKNDFITKHNLVVFRLSDHWKLRRPDPVAGGIAAALGWTNYQAATDARRFAIPALRLYALASLVKKGLGARGGVRVIGDPATRVARVGLLPGTTALRATLDALPGVDAVIAGEVREWESTEYARDVVFSGQRKGLILVGRALSEEPGMNVCATWLRSIVPEVPVRHIAAGDPYWRPA